MFRKLVFFSILTIIFFSRQDSYRVKGVYFQGRPLDCIICEWTESDREINRECYDVPNLPSEDLDVLECNHTAPFCKTEFTFFNDEVTRVIRNCTNGTEDWDKSSTKMPNKEKCVTNFNVNQDSQITTCYLGCENGAGCNSDNFKNLNDIKLCAFNCGPNGKCDYTQGTCICNDGYFGFDCSLRPELEYRKCIQCDSETIANCGIYNQSSNCPEITDRYCAVVSITKYDKEENISREFITRSCAKSYQAADECFISNAFESGGNEVEYTCITTCDTDGCNHRIPDGFVGLFAEDDGETSGKEMQPIRCVVCDSDSDWNCANKTATNVCPSDSTHCVSTVTYYLSEKQDLRYDADPDYELESVIRGCTNESVKTTCEKAMVGRSSLIRTTCTETCSTDGCNTGWPGTPKCSQCSCERCTLEDDCNSNPPLPMDCPFPYQEFCTIQDVDRYVDLDGNNHGYPRMLTRGCSYKGLENKTLVTKFGRDAVPLESINVSCTQNGCNLGYYPFIMNSSKSLQASPICLCLLLLSFLF